MGSEGGLCHPPPRTVWAPRRPQHLLQPVQVLLKPALLQEAPDLSRDVEPDLGVVGHVAYKGKGLVGLQRVRAWAHARTLASGRLSTPWSPPQWAPATSQSLPNKHSSSGQASAWKLQVPLQPCLYVAPPESRSAPPPGWHGAGSPASPAVPSQLLPQTPVRAPLRQP